MFTSRDFRYRYISISRLFKKISKYTLILLVLPVVSCSRTTRSIEEIRSDFGSFENKTIKTLPVDYTKTPIYHTVEHHPEEYDYLDEVELFSIGHISDSLFVTGLMVTPKKEGKYPVIVFNRGGNRDLGHLIVATAVNNLAPIAARGYVVAATNYRGNSLSEGSEQFGGEDVNNIANLIKSMSEIEKADTSRIGLLGLSRGGMMSYLTLKNNYSKNIKAVVSIGGITDLETTIKHHPEIEDVADELIPNFKSNRLLEIQKRSAINWADKLPKSAPILILHGMNDQHVNYSQIPPFADSLKEHSIPYKLVSFENDNHGINEHKEEVIQLITSWFDSHLKNSQSFHEADQRVIIR